MIYTISEFLQVGDGWKDKRWKVRIFVVVMILLVVISRGYGEFWIEDRVRGDIGAFELQGGGEQIWGWEGERSYPGRGFRAGGVIGFGDLWCIYNIL